MKPKTRTQTMVEAQMVIKKYGYKYILVEGSDRSHSDHSQPCFMGFQNMALKACRKIR